MLRNDLSFTPDAVWLATTLPGGLSATWVGHPGGQGLAGGFMSAHAAELRNQLERYRPVDECDTGLDLSVFVLRNGRTVVGRPRG
jgi:hypothetical protein